MSEIFVCLACGKRSYDKYGEHVADRGWDVSCFINSVECEEDRLVVEDGRVIEIKESENE